MEEENQVEEETLDTPTVEEETPETPQVDLEEIRKKAELAENYKIRAEKAEKALKQKPNNQPVSPVDSIDMIKLGKKLKDYSDEELDFVTEFAKSKNPEEILKALENPFVQSGISAYREKVEKEKLTLRPTGTQSESDKPLSITEKLAKAGSMADKEKILKEVNLYKEFRPRSDRTNIGPVGLR